MSSSVMWKACQRRLYSWLSSRCGLPICVVGVLLVIISAFQFGEVFLEWSREKYAVQFSIYADNIAGKSYEVELCPPLPIDVVYTWVNGSDPGLLREVRDLKQRLAKKKSNTTSAHNTTAAPPHSATCPFNNCVPWRTLVIDASNLTTPLTLETLSLTFPSLHRGAQSCERLNASKVHTTPVYLVRLTSEEQVTSILKEGLLDKHGSRVSVARGFLTSDSQLAGAVKMKSFFLALSPSIHPLNSSKLFRKWMESHYGRNVTEVEVKGNGTAVVAFKAGSYEPLPLTIPYQFSGESVALHQGFLVWLPFSLPPTKEQDLERPDVVSASRFQDNEELRYSLRSVERFAPWVRHVFIVTNGQIPSWLNLDYPRVTLVPHEDIFPNHTHLPTYSSPAIESHLHRIPGLADHFIYLNDDVMFGDHVWPEDFYTHQRGQKVYLSWPVPNCAEGCPPSWIRDKYCDANCNNSACDWDGGDCANASRPGPQGGHAGYSHSSSSDHCSPGCLDSWLGDRYCDSACRTLDCGYDAGDCGVEKWEELLSYTLSLSGGNFSVPLETTALYFNLSDVFTNMSISSASHTPSKLVRTAVVSQKFKTLAVTLARNVSWSAVNFTLSAKSGNTSHTVNFTLCGDTATKNTSKEIKKEPHHLLVLYNDTSSLQFLQAVVEQLPPSNKSISNRSINYWVQDRPISTHTAPLPTAISRYEVANQSLLPPDVATALEQLDSELEAGELTKKGYLKRRASLLSQLSSQLVQTNGSVQFGAQEERGVAEGVVNVAGEVPGARKLLQFKEKQQRLLNMPELALLGWEESRRRLPWEKLHIFPETSAREDSYQVKGHRSRRLMEEVVTDTFADSLRHVNRLYTKVYGHATRKVPSHMPHYIQKDIMIALQDRFPEEFEITSSHPVRMADDMQFAFSYFYFLMSEKRVFDVEEMFLELDTDKSGILSVRELRTLLALISSLPITMEDVHKLEEMLKTCNKSYNGTAPQVSAMEYETLYDASLPLVTLDFTKDCPPLLEKLNSTVTERERYKFEEASSDIINFKMINENASEVVGMLDEIRKEKKKFICLNDNIDHSKEGAELSKIILIDFYESLFPLPSQFEIPGQYRNRFLHLRELKEWLAFKERMHQLLYFVFLITLLLSIVSLFYGKLVQWKRKITRTLHSIFVSKRTSPSI